MLKFKITGTKKCFLHTHDTQSNLRLKKRMETVTMNPNIMVTKNETPEFTMIDKMEVEDNLVRIEKPTLLQ